MNDALLDWLGDVFVDNGFISKGWEFHQFVRDFQLGLIGIEVK
ncbi:hypothetical protein MKX47_12425 [Solibacillus sp. FSL R7-0668]